MSEERCEICRYWTRHEPRDAGGFCERFCNSFAMEDDWCEDFKPVSNPPANHRQP